MAPTPKLPLLLPISLLFLLLLATSGINVGFKIQGSTIDAIHDAFNSGELTSRQLVQFYLDRIRSLNPLLRAVIEVNPDAIRLAERADRKRRLWLGRQAVGGLHGIPILLKDNIATADRLNNTAGSLALLGSVSAGDAGVVWRLRRAGAVILGKASLSEWAHFRYNGALSGWSARGGQGRERIGDLGQDIFLMSQKTNGVDPVVRNAIERMSQLSSDGIERLMIEEKLDALVTPGVNLAPVLAIGGYPGISVPAGYGENGFPFGICFGGLKGSEPKLIEIAYAFEQATKVRKPPAFG